ncbi:MAG: hypothetical protein HY033_10260 [Ignavibacteriae bacterium]|nr:hypothetical protein [Ignavibacteria bacterium]MBI3365279.1 hypothetical protein [Ignavibacteriota bacterium]
MSETYTVSETGTYTEARAVTVMLSVLGDLGILASARMISYDKANNWMEDILYLAKARVLQFFELQFYNSVGVKIGTGYRYSLSEDGSLQENSGSGGIDPYDLPNGSKVNLFADVDWTKKNKTEVSSYLASRGWGTNGSPLGGQTSYERGYSKDGYGLMRYKITP